MSCGKSSEDIFFESSVTLLLPAVGSFDFMIVDTLRHVTENATKCQETFKKSAFGTYSVKRRKCRPFGAQGRLGAAPGQGEQAVAVPPLGCDGPTAMTQSMPGFMPVDRLSENRVTMGFLSCSSSSSSSFPDNIEDEHEDDDEQNDSGLFQTGSHDRNSTSSR